MKKECRIKKDETIKDILNTRDNLSDGYFNVFKKKNDCQHFRFAISVGKKYGKAVSRNRVKRRVREVIRQAGIKEDYDIFIIIYPKVEELSFQVIQTRLNQLLRRHKII